jgi:hypothetical protein
MNLFLAVSLNALKCWKSAGPNVQGSTANNFHGPGRLNKKISTENGGGRAVAPQERGMLRTDDGLRFAPEQFGFSLVYTLVTKVWRG